MCYNISQSFIRGYSLVVEHQLPKLNMRVRFPLPAPRGTAPDFVPELSFCILVISYATDEQETYCEGIAKSFIMPELQIELDKIFTI